MKKRISRKVAKKGQKARFVKAVFVDFRQLLKLTGYFRSIQAMLTEASVLWRVLTAYGVKLWHIELML